MSINGLKEFLITDFEKQTNKQTWIKEQSIRFEPSSTLKTSLYIYLLICKNIPTNNTKFKTILF